MTALNDYVINPNDFINRSTILYGASNSGKSFIILDILYNLRDKVDLILVISPSDRQNNTYAGIVPLPCIHYTITDEILTSLWKRQEATSQVHKIASNSETMSLLFNRISGISAKVEFVKSAKRKLQESVNEVNKTQPDKAKAKLIIQRLTEDCDTLVNKVMMQSIVENRKTIIPTNQKEQLCLEYVDLNPRLVLVLDDCTDLLTEYKSHPVIQSMFFRGRWTNLTIIIASHTDKVLAPEIKKNAFIQIFTEERTAHSYFNRTSADLDKDDKKKAETACKAAFTPTNKYQKLLYLRDERKFFKLTALYHEPFAFGSKHLWEFCGKLTTKDDELKADGKYLELFIK